MPLLWTLIGMAPAALCGWLLLRTLEWNTPVLYPLERAAMGTVLGGTLAAFALFVVHTTLRIPVSLTGWLAVYALLLIPLLLLRRRLSGGDRPAAPLPPSPPFSLAWQMLLFGLGAWTAMKIAAMTMLLLFTPSYFDDTIDNWNLRGTLFYHTQRIELTLPHETEPGGISSYPPTVPLLKAWVSSLRGGWDDATANTLHLSWFLCCLTLAYCAVRRHASRQWGLIAAYALASLPLFLMQGTNAYADVFLSSHVLIAALLLSYAASATTASSAITAVRLAGVATALLIFTKNEALALYLPVLVASGSVTLWWLWKRGILSTSEATQSLAMAAVAVLAVAVPWVLYKWANGLTFGNAHSVSELTFSWQKNVVMSILVNTFFEGNWLLLFPLLLLLPVLRWRDALQPMIFTLLLFFLLAYGLQALLYLFTGLSAEALMQTGYARGVIHLVPVAVIAVTMLLERVVGEEK